MISSPDATIIKYTWEGKEKILTFKRNDKYGIMSAITLYTSDIRKLSDNSRIASSEILDLATDSIQIAQNSGNLMEQVVPDIQKVTDLINEIASASNEQKIGLEQVNQGMNQLSTVAQQNASSSEELAATSTLLHNNMKKVKDAISYFEL
ncbi:MAG: hypothetical protein KDK90_14050 [Leptospiraceae bacterium]|nr:hypothetical protein [Leptospiraceae bacterium]